MDRTTWLDGLRGIAAAIVALDHYFMGGLFEVAFRSYWADPPEDNRRIIQLPPIRLLFASHAMVPLFFVISGYALSVNLLAARQHSMSAPATTTTNAHAHATNGLLRKLSSAATRRIFRIYLPVFVIATISQILYFCGVYHWDFGDGVLWGRRPWTAPMFHLTYLGRYLLDITNIIQFHQNPGLNGQLWTMPFEFRGSLIVYLTILALAFWRPGFRRGALMVMMLYFFYYGLWDIFGFLAGLYLAEGAVAEQMESVEEETKLPFHNILQVWKNKVRSVNFTRIWVWFCFTFGIYLLCLSDDGVLPPDYHFLRPFQSSRWDDDWAVLSKSWKCAGSVFLVYAIGKTPILQRPLNSKVVQYLGKISFSLYLVHQSVYHIMMVPVRDVVWFVVKGQTYEEVEDPVAYPLAFGFTWVVTFVFNMVLVGYASHFYTRFVDVRCVGLARRIEKWVTV